MAEDDIYKQIRNNAGALGGIPAEAVAATVISAVAAVIDNELSQAHILSQSVAGPAGSALQGLYGLVKIYAQRNGVHTIPNPAFEMHGIATDSNGAAEYYLKRRTRVATAGKFFSAASAVSSVATLGVNSGKLAPNGNVDELTGMHMWKLKVIAKKFRSDYCSKMIESIIRMKKIKANFATTQLVGGAIPIPLVGFATGIAAAFGSL